LVRGAGCCESFFQIMVYSGMNARIFLATTGKGLARAERTGDRWAVQFLLERIPVHCLAADRLQPGRVCAGTDGRGVYCSDDWGLTWERLGLHGATITAIAISQHRPGVIYAGSKPAGMFRSDDSGSTWRELMSFRRIPGRWMWFSPAEPPFHAHVQAVALSPEDPDVIVAGVKFGAVVRSEDGGETWTGHQKGALRDCTSLTFHSNQGRWVYQAGGSGGGAAISWDGGRSWRGASAGLDRHYGWAVAADPAQPEIWYLSASPPPGYALRKRNAQAAIFRSVAGASWEKLSGGLPNPLDYRPCSLVSDPSAPGNLYAGLSNGEIWFTEDYGVRWARLSAHLGAIQAQMAMLAE
jgi:hypothetical protein